MKLSSWATITKPHQATLDALEASLPLLDEAGIQHSLVNEIGCPYIIENIVPAAPHLRNPMLLCGTMFGLGVFRHRLFEASFAMLTPGHPAHAGKIGDGKYCTVTGHAGGSSKRDGWKNGGVAEWRVAMGIDWMVGDESAEAIPPDYAEFVGRFAIAALAAQEEKP